MQKLSGANLSLFVQSNMAANGCFLLFFIYKAPRTTRLQINKLAKLDQLSTPLHNQKLSPEIKEISMTISEKYIMEDVRHALVEYSIQDCIASYHEQDVIASYPEQNFIASYIWPSLVLPATG